MFLPKARPHIRTGFSLRRHPEILEYETNWHFDGLYNRSEAEQEGFVIPHARGF
jgi:hypothetical protein